MGPGHLCSALGLMACAYNVELVERLQPTLTLVRLWEFAQLSGIFHTKLASSCFSLEEVSGRAAPETLL